MSTLRLLVSNVLYRGDIAHQGVIYPGEHPALVSRELRQDVNAKHKLSRTKIRRHRSVETPLKGLLRCAQCGALLTESFTLRQGQRQLYYVCRAGKKQQPICPQQPVRADDLEQSLRERLERRGTTSRRAPRTPSRPCVRAYSEGPSVSPPTVYFESHRPHNLRFRAVRTGGDVLPRDLAPPNQLLSP